MATTPSKTRRLTVNAAFLKDIKDDNHDLKVLMDKLRPLVLHHQIAINHWPELIRLLGDLRDQLAFHFALEEAYGYFDEAAVVAPRLSSSAEHLRGQHGGLFERVRCLADKALEIPADSSEHVTRFLNEFHRFQHEFAQHEEAELELILDALEDEMGAVD